MPTRWWRHQVTSCAAHRGRAVVVTRSVILRRPSRQPIHAAAPVTGGTKSSSAPCCMVVARRFHMAGSCMLLR